jgi:transposase-like protein
VGKKSKHPDLGRTNRKGLSIVQLIKMFPDDRTAEAWIAGIRWPKGFACPHCGSSNVQCGAKHPSMNYRCRTCHRFYSVRTGTVMQHSNLGAQKWVIATHMLTTGLQGEAGMKLHRALGITQTSAWHLAHRIRETWDRGEGTIGGHVEIEGTYIGGKRRKISNAKRKDRADTGRGAACEDLDNRKAVNHSVSELVRE